MQAVGEDGVGDVVLAVKKLKAELDVQCARNDALAAALKASEANDADARCHVAELEAKCTALAAENDVMLRLLTDISENHLEYLSEGEDCLMAGVPLDYVSEINMYVSRDVNAENPFPATDAWVNEQRAAARKEGAYFVANRMLAAWDAGFIDDTAKNAADIARMILTSTEFMTDASEGDFNRSFADSVLGEIAAQLRGSQV
ncbi:hypothetical protein [Atlantibacter hermannii]|uniref:hypothetical protein n=1 Tax=Atlantibacter hermannii TaxID=565 RepID=UPI003B20DDD2